MGNRRTKTLILNGVAVGEYEGSDDPDEDTEAARAALQARGLYKPPSELSAMRSQATGFAVTAELAYERMQRRSAAMPPVTTIPFIVNGAFAVELYLKTMLRARGVTMPKRLHELVRLHALLPEPDRAALDAMCEHHRQRYDSAHSEPLAARLAPLSDAFVRWRYAYEHERVGFVRPGSLIVVIRACHEHCKAATAS